MKYRAVFLDMDHTLCDTDRADHLGVKDFQQTLNGKIKSESGKKISEAYLKAIYGENRDVKGWGKEPGETETDYRIKLLKKSVEQEIGVVWGWDELSNYTKLFMEQRIKHFSFFPRTIEMLSRLRKKYKLILVSNGPLFSQQPKIEKVDMAKYVDHIILGGALKHQKPHPSIFNMACEKAGCRANEAIHVGDNLDTDIQGAINAGITSVWLNPTKAEESLESLISFDHRIENILELEPLLAKISR